MDWGKLLVSSQGRIGRKSYWLFIGAMAVLGVGVSVVEYALFRTDDGPIYNLITLGTIWFWVCVVTKRLHDLGLSGWWQPLGYGALLAAAVIAPPAWGEGGRYLVFFTTLVAVFGTLGAIRGRPAANKYGEPNSGDRDVTPVTEVFS